jgi:hypothetical protein
METRGHSVLRAVAVAASAALLVTALAVPVVAKTHCTDYVDGDWNGNVPAGMVLCGGDGDDTVHGTVYGTFIGGDGDDAIIATYGIYYGTFDGGGGNDSIKAGTTGVLDGGTFIGGGGNDSITAGATGVYNATFIGGGGDDSIKAGWGYGLAYASTFDGGGGNDSIEAGACAVGSLSTFDGGNGNDTIKHSYRYPEYVALAGTFDGGNGSDHVAEMGSPTASFDGGRGVDTLDVYDDGSCANVEVYPAGAPC